MILSYIHKGLEDFAKDQTTKGIEHAHVRRIELILNALDTATCIDDFDLPGKRLHRYTGIEPPLWSLDVSGNVRITFEFDGKDVRNVDYGDPHKKKARKK